MSVHAEGTITAPTVNRDHQEPFQTLELGSVASGSTASVQVGKYVNKGNVEQTISVMLANLVGCTPTELKFTDDNSVETQDTVTLAPGVGANLAAIVKLADEVIGSTDQPFSFDVESTWS